MRSSLIKLILKRILALLSGIFVSVTLADVCLQTRLILIFPFTKLTSNWRADNVLARNVSLKILSALWIFPTLWTSKQPLVNFSNHRIQIKVAYKTWISNSNLQMSFNIGCSLTKRIFMFLHVLPERISGLWHKPTKFTWNPFGVHMLGLNMGLNIFNEHLELSVTHKTKVFSILVTNHTIDYFIKFSMSSWDKSNVLGRNTEKDIKWENVILLNTLFPK